MRMITLYDYIQSELINQGFSEFKDENNKIVFFNEEYQFMTKILTYDNDVQKIVDTLFTGTSLRKREYDTHFKRSFVSRFAERQINRQTVEAFQLQLLTTFLSNETYLNELYENIDKYVNQTQENKQTNEQLSKNRNDGTTTSDNRQAYADLPQNNVQIDVDDTVMTSASDNTISRNKQTNKQETENESSGETTNETKSYSLNELFKIDGLLDHVLDEFDRKCFLQIW